jgi:hypothetical protein
MKKDKFEKQEKLRNPIRNLKFNWLLFQHNEFSVSVELRFQRIDYWLLISCFDNWAIYNCDCCFYTSNNGLFLYSKKSWEVYQSTLENITFFCCIKSVRFCIFNFSIYLGDLCHALSIQPLQYNNYQCSWWNHTLLFALLGFCTLWQIKDIQSRETCRSWTVEWWINWLQKRKVSLYLLTK